MVALDIHVFLNNFFYFVEKEEKVIKIGSVTR